MNTSKRRIIVQAISSCLMIFAYPFVELWLAAVFLEKNEGLISCLRKGFNASIKNYKTLVVASAVLLLPTLVLLVLIKNPYTMISSPVYICTFIYQAIVVPIILSYFFTLYNGIMKPKLIDN